MCEGLREKRRLPFPSSIHKTTYDSIFLLHTGFIVVGIVCFSDDAFIANLNQVTDTLQCSLAGILEK